MAYLVTKVEEIADGTTEFLIHLSLQGGEVPIKRDE